MRATEVADEDRAAYHAAASIAANFLVDARGRRRAPRRHRRASSARCSRRSCAPRSRTGRGSAREAALTGPIARGDEATVARQRAASRSARPTCCPLFDALADATRALAPVPMRTVRTIADVRGDVAATPARPAAASGSCPTMGAFHAGHAALMRAARERCDHVVVSLFVNPTQFDDPPTSPPTRARRRRTPRSPQELGVDVLCAPPAAEMYPEGFATDGHRRRASATVLEGAARGPGTSPACARSSPSCSTSSRPTSPSSARRTPSRSPCCAGWSAT